MNETLSVAMWVALFEVAHHNDISVVTKATVDALVKRGLIERYGPRPWQLTPHGRKIVSRVVAFDVS